MLSASGVSNKEKADGRGVMDRPSGTSWCSAATGRQPVGSIVSSLLCRTYVDCATEYAVDVASQSCHAVNARFLVPYHPPCSNAAEGYGQHSNVVDDRWWHLNTCERRVRTRQWERYVNLGLLTITYGGAFWDHIVSWYFVQYRIVSIISPWPYRAITISQFFSWSDLVDYKYWMIK